MRSLLAVAMIAALALVYVGSAQQPQQAPTNYDLDHDGVISILDLTDLATHMGQIAAPCLHVTRIHYATPIVSVDTNGNPILIEGRAEPDANDPLVPALLSGTPVMQCP